MRNKGLKAACLALAMALLLGFATPLTTAAAEAPPEAASEAYIVMDADTGQVLVAKNPHLAEYPASITKIMTLALTLEYVDMQAAHNEPVKASQSAVDALIHRATMISLASGEVATLEDLLYATQIASANDAANVLAEYICGSMDGFANLMNEKLRQLGLSGSHFMNPSGQPDDEHYVTAYDMAAITRWALTVPGFTELFGTTEYTMDGTNKVAGERHFNTNNLIMVPQSGYYCEGVIGSKTGYTDLARYTLVTVAEREGTRLICVSLNNPFNADKYNSTNALLDYCFDNFKPTTFPVDAVETQKVAVYGGGDEALGEIDVYGKGEASFLLHRSLGLGAIEVRNEIPESYVIGDDFAPQTALYLPEDCTQQYGGLLGTVPLNWRGLDEIMAANTTESAFQRLVEEKPLQFWLMVAGVSLLLGLVVWRIVFVLVRRQRRRLKRLQAARAQRPIRIAERPAPPQRLAANGRERPWQGSGSRPNLEVASRQPASSPRRVGQAR